MPTEERTFVVAPTPKTVLEYLKDFAHAEQWDPGTERCVRIESAGPIGVGAQWHNTSKIAGSETELTYTLRELADDHVVFVGENDSATTTDHITVVPHGTGSEITYRADLELQGAAKLATPLASLGLRKLGKDTEEQLTEVLNALAGSASSARDGEHHG